MKKTFYFVHFKKRAVDAMKLGGARVNELVEKVKYHIRVKKILAYCPDERTRRQMMARIEAEERRIEIYNARLRNYQDMISLGFLEMVEALTAVYARDPKEPLTKTELKQAKELFHEGKTKLLMYSRWLSILNPNSCGQAWADAIEPLEIDSFSTSDAWLDFFNNLPVS